MKVLLFSSFALLIFALGGLTGATLAPKSGIPDLVVGVFVQPGSISVGHPAFPSVAECLKSGKEALPKLDLGTDQHIGCASIEIVK